MSRIDIREMLYNKHFGAQNEEFDYDKLVAPPLYSMLSPTDIGDLNSIATSLKLSGNIDRKYKLMDEIMLKKCFRRTHSGTNRLVYEFMEYPYIIAKVAMDRVGITDSPREFKNQYFLKPYCCKVFEVDDTGTVGIMEKVNPISSLEQFMDTADDIFLVMYKILGKYVIDDIGVTRYMNYGIRPGFGPVLVDFPYAYELDGNKLICNNLINTPNGIMPCCGEIDYDVGFTKLYCTKCGKTYQARDLARKENNRNKILIMKGDDDVMLTRTRVMRGDEVILEVQPETSNYVTKEQIESINGGSLNNNPGYQKVAGTIMGNKCTRYSSNENDNKPSTKQTTETKKPEKQNKDVHFKLEKVVMTTQDPDENVDKIQIPRCVEDEIKDNADKSMYTETVSMFNDQMLAYFELKINKRGKITKNGKYVSIKNLKKMIHEYNKDQIIQEI